MGDWRQKSYLLEYIKSRTPGPFTNHHFSHLVYQLPSEPPSALQSTSGRIDILFLNDSTFLKCIILVNDPKLGGSSTLLWCLWWCHSSKLTFNQNVISLYHLEMDEKLNRYISDPLNFYSHYYHYTTHNIPLNLNL